MTARDLAARNAAQSITSGILMDACNVMLRAGAFEGRGVGQAERVAKWCQAVLDDLPQLTSSRGVKNLAAVCDTLQQQFVIHWPHLPADSGMSACARIFALQATVDELRRCYGLRTKSWRYLSQTALTLVAMILADIPEEEERMWSAAVPVIDQIMEVAA